MKYCTKCNDTYEDKSVKFCGECGEKLISEISYYGNIYSQGDRCAFEKIYELTIKSTTIYAKNAVPDIEVEDCVQSIYIKLINNIHSFNPEKASFNTWFQTLRTNEIITYQKKFKNLEQDFPELELYLENQENNDLCSVPGIEYEKQECKELVLEMLNKLPEEQRDCIIRFFIEGKKQTEIASYMEIPIGTVKSRLSHGKASLRKIVESYEQQGVYVRSVAPFTFFLFLIEGSGINVTDIASFGVYSEYIVPELSSGLIEANKLPSLNTNSLLNSTEIVSKTAATSSVKFGVTKLIAVISVVGTIGAGGALMYEHEINKRDNEVLQEHVIETVEDTMEEMVDESDERSVEDIINEFREIVDVYHTGVVEFKLHGIEYSNYVSDELVDYGVELYGGGFGERYEDIDKIYYGVYDLNGDGEIEMLISSRHPYDIDNYHVLYYDTLYTCYEGEIKFLIDREYEFLRLYNNGKIGLDIVDYELGLRCYTANIVDGALVFDDDKRIEVDTDNEWNEAYYNEYFSEHKLCENGTVAKENDGYVSVDKIEWYEFTGIDQEDIKIEFN